MQQGTWESTRENLKYYTGKMWWYNSGVPFERHSVHDQTVAASNSSLSSTDNLISFIFVSNEPLPLQRIACGS